MCKFDLKNGYYHLDKKPEFKEYLEFSWEFNGEKKFLVWAVLPFGLSIGPYLLTKLLRPVVRFWRSKGRRILIYIEDGFFADENEGRLAATAIKVKHSLEKLGFICNEKSVWKPVQRMDFLGFSIELKKIRFRLKKEKFRRITNGINVLLRLEYGTAR